MVAFLSYVHQFSDFTILFGVLIAGVIPVIVAPYVGRLIFRGAASEERFSAAQDGFKAIASILGVLIAFSLVQANGNVRAAQEQVAKEAAIAQAIDRTLLRSGREDYIAMRPMVAGYLKSRIEQEWPELEKGRRSFATDDAYALLSKAVRGLNPADARQTALYNELLKAMDDLSDMREMTIAESDPYAFGLGSFYWVAISVFCGISLALAVLTKPSLPSAATIGAAASAVALMLALLIIVDQPFQGETSVSTDPLQQAIIINARRA